MTRHRFDQGPDAAATIDVEIPVGMPRSRVFTARVDGRGEVGYMEARYNRFRQAPGHPPGVVVVSRVRVEPSHRGTGVARQLYRAAADHARTLGVPLVSDTALSNDARALWERRVGEGRAVAFDDETDDGRPARAYMLLGGSPR